MDQWYILGGAVLCAAIAFLVWRRRSRRPSSMSPVVYNLLESAVEQGGYMSVHFTDGAEPAAGQAESGEQFLGPCRSFDARTVCIDIGSNAEFPDWTGRTVNVNFRVNGKKSSSYYQFTSRIQSLTRRNGNLCLLLDTPEEILSSQKRRFVRIPPLREAIHGLGVWKLDDDAPRPHRPATMGKAQLRYRLGQEGPLTLADISAAGLRLELNREAAEAAGIQVSARLLCLLMLAPAKEGTPLSFWLDCTVTNMLELENKLFFGLNFDAWATAQKATDFVEWTLAGENGWIGPLGTWVWHQQLAQVAQAQEKSIQG